MYCKKKTYIRDEVRIIKFYGGNFGNHSQRRPKELCKRQSKKMEKSNARLCVQKLFDLMQLNFKAGDWHLALTYPSGTMNDPAEAQKHLSNFLKRLKRHCTKMQLPWKYIYVTHVSKKGAVHHHIILPQEISFADIQSKWKSDTGNGTVVVNNVLYQDFDYYGLAAYLLRYQNETGSFDESVHSAGGKRFKCSQNLIRPKEEYEVIHSARWRPEPTAPKGYRIKPDSIYNSTDQRTGYPFQSYVLIPDTKRRI